jgi:branched-chain amino acid transport system permease protein
VTAPQAVVRRWTRLSSASVAVVVATQVLLVAAPAALPPWAVDRLTSLYIYCILAMMWSALAGYAGLVSVGQQAFFGLGAYAAIRLSDLGVGPYPSLLLGALLVGAVSVPVALFMLRLRAGEFAIGMWVVAELAHLLVNLDPMVQGETGTSLVALQGLPAGDRRAFTYWAALATMAFLAWLGFLMLRGRLGIAAQAIRDDEQAAASIGIRVGAAKRAIFVFAAFGCAAAGALWVATVISFQPRTYFGIQWTAYMVFMVLVGGLGTYEGPILGALLFFAIETLFGAAGVWYLVGLGATAMLFALLLPGGIWGKVEERWGIHLLPVGYRLGEAAAPPGRGPDAPPGRRDRSGARRAPARLGDPPPAEPGRSGAPSNPT